MRNLILVFTIIPFLVFSQKNEKKAKKYLANSNYTQAANAYIKLSEKNPENFHYLTIIGDCMVKMNKPSKAVQFYEKAYSLVNNDIAEKKLMMAYMKNGEFIKAMSIADRKIQRDKTGNNTDLKKVISSCKVGQTLTAHPLHLELRNLGSDINSNEDDILPFMTANQERVVFSSNRDDIKAKTLKSGSKPYEIFGVEKINDQFRNVEEFAAPVNTKVHDFIMGLSADQSYLFTQSGHEPLSGNLQVYSNINGNYMLQNKDFENLKNFKNIQGVTVTDDLQEMYFASDHSSSLGGLDLYISRKLPNGRWSEPENMGAGINTEKDESFPQLAQYDMYLYFSSDGHPGMGGKDLFKTKRIDDGWKSPQNLGYPLSTPFDDLNIAVNEKGNMGYISTVGEDSYGGYDIYEFEFKEITIKHAVMLVYLKDMDGEEILDAPMVIMDHLDNMVGTYYANDNTRRYTLALKPGEYTIELADDEYENYSTKIVVSPNNLNKFNNELHLTVGQ